MRVCVFVHVNVCVCLCECVYVRVFVCFCVSACLFLCVSVVECLSGYIPANVQQLVDSASTTEYLCQLNVPVRVCSKSTLLDS